MVKKLLRLILLELSLLHARFSEIYFKIVNVA